MGKTPPFARFLEGGGKMGELIQTRRWADTTLGSPDHWPQSLLTTLSILLHSRFPTVLFWGPDSLTFYNDAYSHVLIERDQHPHALGAPAKDIWPTRWTDIKTKIDHILTGGAAIWFEDTPIVTPGQAEVYWTGSYSHVLDETGLPAGVLITCTDTTEKVLNLRHALESQKSFQNIVKQTPAGIVIFEGPEFIVTTANEAYLEIVDKPEEQLVGKPFFDTLPEIRELIHPLLTNVLETGNPYYGYEFPVTLIRNGQPTPTWFNFVYQPLRTGDKVTGVIVVAHEVSAMAKARQELLASETTFRNMVMHSPMAMTIFKGKDFIIEYANANMFGKMWRKKEHEVLGKKLFEVFPELLDQKYPDLLKEVYTSGKVHKETDSLAYVAGNDGMRQFYLDYEYAPLLDANGQVWGIMVTVNDTTSRVEARTLLETKVRERTADLQHTNQQLEERTADLQHTNQQLEQSNQDLQQFAHVASHDLKEPVRKIKIFSGRLESEFHDAVGPQGHTYLEKILKSTNRIFEMINGILTYSSLPGVEQPRVPIDLNVLIHNIESDLELLIQDKHATIIKSELPVIMGMPDLIHQLFYNLLNNALKFAKKNEPAKITLSVTYSPTSTQSPIITRSANVTHRSADVTQSPIITRSADVTHSPRYVCISVRDNGIGFNNEYAEAIFSTFKRLNSKDLYEGTGLGLSLCKKIVERHGGYITAKGTPGEGAEFSIYLPDEAPSSRPDHPQIP